MSYGLKDSADAPSRLFFHFSSCGFGRIIPLREARLLQNLRVYLFWRQNVLQNDVVLFLKSRQSPLLSLDAYQCSDTLMQDRSPP